MRKVLLPLIPIFLSFTACFEHSETETFDAPRCSNAKYNLDNKKIATYLNRDIQQDITAFESYRSGAVGSGREKIDTTEDNITNFALVWDVCGDNKTYDLATLILSGNGYVSSFSKDSSFEGSVNKTSCLDENITVLAGTFQTEHCTYSSKDTVYSYEIYRLNTSDVEQRPMGGIIYYIGFENGIENYSVELSEWKDR